MRVTCLPDRSNPVLKLSIQALLKTPCFRLATSTWRPGFLPFPVCTAAIGWYDAAIVGDPAPSFNVVATAYTHLRELLAFGTVIWSKLGP